MPWTWFLERILANFQYEYARRVDHVIIRADGRRDTIDSGVEPAVAAKQAVEAISLGKHRIALGYSNISVVPIDPMIEKDFPMPGSGDTIRATVPSNIEVWARKPSRP